MPDQKLEMVSLGEQEAEVKGMDQCDDVGITPCDPGTKKTNSVGKEWDSK